MEFAQLREAVLPWNATAEQAATLRLAVRVLAAEPALAEAILGRDEPLNRADRARPTKQLRPQRLKVEVAPVVVGPPTQVVEQREWAVRPKRKRKKREFADEETAFREAQRLSELLQRPVWVYSRPARPGWEVVDVINPAKTPS